MKALLTFLFSVGIISASFAQYSHRNDYPERNDHTIYNQRNERSIYNNNDRGYSSFYLSAKQRDAEIKDIKKEFKKRIKEAKKTRGLRSSERDREVRMLEWQRDRAIQDVNDRFNSNRNTYNHPSGYDNSDPYARSNSRRW